jgi:hypothetical protein
MAFADEGGHTCETCKHSPNLLAKDRIMKPGVPSVEYEEKVNLAHILRSSELEWDAELAIVSWNGELRSNRKISFS